MPGAAGSEGGGTRTAKDTSSSVCGPTMCVVARTQKFILLLVHVSSSFFLGPIAVCMLHDHCLQICNQNERCCKASELILDFSCVCYLLSHTGKGSIVSQSQCRDQCPASSCCPAADGHQQGSAGSMATCTGCPALC